jgi:hypothetical protein
VNRVCCVSVLNRSAVKRALEGHPPQLVGRLPSLGLPGAAARGKIWRPGRSARAVLGAGTPRSAPIAALEVVGPIGGQVGLVGVGAGRPAQRPWPGACSAVRHR